MHSNGNLAFQTYSRQMVKVLWQPLATLPVSVSSVYVLERRPGNSGHGEMWLTLLAHEPPRVVMELLQGNLSLCNSLQKFIFFCRCLVHYSVQDLHFMPTYILIQLTIIKIVIFFEIKIIILPPDNNNPRTHLRLLWCIPSTYYFSFLCLACCNNENYFLEIKRWWNCFGRIFIISLDGIRICD